ncbi:MAG: type II toxin-antitoxin system Phd/YefM family antitoxin [Alphaproteobacteria bacterium]|nr:type II toxin-antitoxin system Phd/YefM family antitoxin [Alphaproteobacteria bacterium]
MSPAMIRKQDCSSTDLQNHFGQVMEQLREGPVTVTRHNLAMAVLMLPEAFDALVAAADAGLAARAMLAESEGFVGVEAGRALLGGMSARKPGDADPAGA